jgi:hypothetical protein
MSKAQRWASTCCNAIRPGNGARAEGLPLRFVMLLLAAAMKLRCEPRQGEQRIPAHPHRAMRVRRSWTTGELLPNG